MHNVISFIFLIGFPVSEMMNLLPCTEPCDQGSIDQARVVITDATPADCIFVDVRPQVRLGRNPHRWIGVFHSNINDYNTGCQAMAHLKQTFKQLCPQGSEISSVSIIPLPNGPTIEVEYLVNCFCSKTPRRRRALFNRWCPQAGGSGYIREPGICPRN